eukprot:SAG22_NODE_718_length_7670_cov_11.194690_6_plen_389_part_00
MATIASAVGDILTADPDMGVKKVVASVKKAHPELAESANSKAVREAMAAHKTSLALGTAAACACMDGVPDDVMIRILSFVGVDDLGAVAAAARRYRGGVRSVLETKAPELLREGLELMCGNSWRVQNNARGLVLVRAAAVGGLPLAVVHSRLERWARLGGAADGTPEAAVQCFRQIIAAAGRTRKRCPDTVWMVAEAEAMIARCYWSGVGVGKDLPAAVAWYGKAAAKGSSTAENMLGLCHALGLGVPKDGAEASKWYRKAAERGHSGAGKNVGDRYWSGDGVARDRAEALKWFRQAAEQGHGGAQHSLATCYYDGEAVEKDHVQAEKWLRLGAENGQMESQSLLGNWYYAPQYYAHLVPQDSVEAMRWFRLAAEQGDANAQTMLGAA